MTGTVLNVPTQTYYDAADLCAKAASDLFNAFKTAMRSFGDTALMSGSVGEGKQWGESYDQQAKDAYAMSIDLVTAIDGYAQVLKAAGYNYAFADHDPKSGQPEPTQPNLNPSFTLTPQELTSLLVPPSAGGEGRGLIDDGLELAAKVGIPVPDGNTEKLVKSQNVWNGLATNATVTAIPGQLERAAAMFEQVTSPEVNFFDEDLRELKAAAEDLIGVYGELAKACEDQKLALDDLRADLVKLLEDMVKSMAREVVENAIIGIVASSVTLGLGAAVVVAKTAKSLDRFVDLIRTLLRTKKLRSSVTVTRATPRSKSSIQRIKDLKAKLLERFRSKDKNTRANASNTPGTPEYKARLEEMAKDPAHGGNISDKSRREAEVALAMERNGQLTPPVTRAPMVNGKDTGDFVDGDGKHWDMKQPTDTFPASAGPKAGQPMPPTMRGAYNEADFEKMVADELATGESVMIDPQNLSTAGLQSVEQVVARHPEWAGKVVIHGN
ncbi:hypothetical protein [Nocardia lijiangensis]|uniref:hypothetical protein n=1 Tax=Nocardia lijiangensis TaxID=299618 RepID=UPI00082FF0AE|nr:hypothetical protein [Nocardia lijiangensis]